MINRVELVGRLGKDPEVRHTGSGNAVYTFSVATDRSWKDKQSGEWKKQTDWHACIAWDKSYLDKYHKGDLVRVEGRLQTRSYDDKKTGEKRYVTEVVAEDVKNLSFAAKGSQQRESDEVPF